ncbi:tethering complex subunit PEP5 RNJ42_00673 [Nakaseomyces bracarensis]|uniref:tethering complex subunit PEP5 n=1 Tax=Nakaseomyces bracarensis TaxID=273131 RepID=UPI0038723941
MSLESWRQFQFYDNVPIRDPLTGGDTLLFSDPTLSAAAVINDDLMFIAVNAIYIRYISIKNAKIVHEFKAFGDGFQISYMRVVASKFLVAIGEKVGSPSQIKIYDIAKLPDNEFSFHSMVEVKNSENTFPISTVCISTDLNYIVVGFINGKIILVKGDLSRDRGAQQRVLYEDPTREPLTTLFLNADNTYCFASTTSKILLFNITKRNRGNPDLILNNSAGLALNCGYYSGTSDEFICCLDNVIEFYHDNGEKHNLPLNIKNVKKVIALSRTELLIVYEEEHEKSTSLNFDSGSTNIVNKIAILDLENSVMSYSYYTTSNIIDIFYITDKETNLIYLLTSDGLLIRLTNKSLSEKIEIVIDKELFPFALQLAHDNHLDDKSIQEIHKRYGDYLFNKNMKSEATKEYINCIDILDISETISKIGSEDISNTEGLRDLADFLQALVKRGDCNEDCVTLLLTVFIKLQDTEEMLSFINNFRRNGQYVEDDSFTDLTDDEYFYEDKKLFDLELILTLLIDSKYYRLAYLLANKFSRTAEPVVEILLVTLNDTEMTLRYIKSLSIDDILRILIKFAKKLLTVAPNETNLLLIDVFTGKYKPIKYDADLDSITSERESSPDEKQPVFYSYKTFFNYMNPLSDRASILSGNTSNEVTENNDQPTYHPPKPSLVFNAFLSKPFQFVVFLEACLDSYNKFEGFDNDKQEILTTLYDLYLSLANEDVQERKAEWKRKANQIYEESNTLLARRSKESKDLRSDVDNSLMMLISHMNNVKITERVNNGKGSSSEKYDTSIIDQFRELIITGDALDCFSFYEANAEKEKELYPIALKYFVSRKEVLNSIGGEEILKTKVLKNIIENRTMNLLDILKLMSSSDFISYGVIKDFLLDHIEEEERDIKHANKLIESYQSELETKQNRLEELLDPNHEENIQIKDAKCHSCQTSLELSIVYFKCGHIYHQRCLNGEQDPKVSDTILFKCPKCIIDIETSNRKLESQKELSMKREVLDVAFESIGPNADRFKVISEFIGKGGLDTAYTIP